MRSLVVAVVALLAVPAGAAEWWVEQGAAAGGDGSSAQPFRTLTEAKAALQTGDTMWVRDGTYAESVDFWHVPAGTGGRTTIRAAAGHSPVIDGGGASFTLQAGETPQMTFQGLTVRNAESAIHFYYADDGEVIDCTTLPGGNGVDFYYSNRGYVTGSDLGGGVSGRHSDGTVLLGNRIHDSAAEGITIYGNSQNLKYVNNIVYDNVSVNIYLDAVAHVLVDGNLVYMTEDPPSDLAGIQLADEAYSDVTAPVLDDITIVNNVVVNCWGGIVFWQGEFPGQSALRNVTIANNTVVNSTGVALSWDSGPHQNAVVRNNIFADEAGVGVLLLLARSTSGVTLDHNLWWAPSVAEPFNWGGGTAYDHAGWVSASGAGAGDVTADPLFAGAWGLPATNLALGAASPARDTGVPVAGIDHDFLFNERPAGPAWDLGALEYGAAPFPDGGGPHFPDGGTTSDGGGAGDGGAAGDGATGDGGSGHGASGGCGCRAAGSNAGARLGPLGLLLAGTLLRRAARGRR